MRLVAALVIAIAVQPSTPEPREVAVTFDDLPVASVLDDNGKSWTATTYTLLTALLRHRVPATGFVNEQKLERAGAVDPLRLEYLRDWLKSFELGNHTYSHLDFHSADLEVFQRDVLRGETIIRRMAAEAGKPLRFFRHPYLHTGRSLATRDQLQRFLDERGYRVAPVTMDNYDYIFSAAFERSEERPSRERIADEYVRYLTDVVTYYERQSVAIVGREIRQILILHANALNASVFDDVALMLRNRGYTFIALDRALEDPVYRTRDTYVGPGGITWLHRWALTQGARCGIFAGEPVVPEWIQDAARPRPRG